MTASRRPPHARPVAAARSEVLSTRQVALLIGVSEATVKRWSDEGHIDCARTPGGHRKFRRPQVAAFMALHRMGDA